MLDCLLGPHARRGLRPLRPDQPPPRPHHRAAHRPHSRRAGGFGHEGNGQAQALSAALADLDGTLRPFDTDPPAEEALRAADGAAAKGRALVAVILASACRSDRLGQHVRNFFECLGLNEEGAELALKCGERPDSPLR